MGIWSALEWISKKVSRKSERPPNSDVVKQDELLKSLVEKKDELCETIDQNEREFEQLLSKGLFAEDLSTRITKRHNDRQRLLLRQLAGVQDLLNKAQTLTQDVSKMSEEQFAYWPILQQSNLGRSRDTMPQIAKDNYGKTLDHLKDKVGITQQTVAVNQLKPSQSEINVDKVRKKMSLIDEVGIEGPDDFTLMCSSDMHLVDGHHMWAALLQMDPSMTITVNVVDEPIKPLLARLNKLKHTSKADINDVKKALDSCSLNQLIRFASATDISLEVRNIAADKIKEHLLK